MLPTGYLPLGWLPPGYLPIADDVSDPAQDAVGAWDSSGTTEALRLPGTTEARIWDEFARRVRADPDLRRVGVTIRTWDGGDDDDAIGPPPWLRFSPSGGKATPFALGILAVPMTVHVDMLTAGKNVRDAMNLWGVLAGVIHAREFQAALRALGANSIALTESPYGIRPHVPKYEPTQAGSLFADGAIEIKIFRRTGAPWT